MPQTAAIQALTFSIPLISIEFEIMCRSLQIYRNTYAMPQTAAIQGLTFSIPLISGEFEIMCRSLQIYRNTSAILQTQAIQPLTIGISLTGRHYVIGRYLMEIRRTIIPTSRPSRVSHLSFATDAVSYDCFTTAFTRMGRIALVGGRRLSPAHRNDRTMLSKLKRYVLLSFLLRTQIVRESFQF
jgi:hypothetical protein